MAEPDSSLPPDPASRGGETSRAAAPPPVPPSEAERTPHDPPHESWLASALKSVFGAKSSMRSSLADAIEAASVESGFSLGERAMLKNILELGGRRVEDVMVPRADIYGVPKDIPLRDLLTVFATAGHSRLVVYDETLDD